MRRYRATRITTSITNVNRKATDVSSRWWTVRNGHSRRIATQLWGRCFTIDGDPSAGRAQGDPSHDSARAGPRAPDPHPAGREIAAQVRTSASSPPLLVSNARRKQPACQSSAFELTDPSVTLTEDFASPTTPPK